MLTNRNAKDKRNGTGNGMRCKKFSYKCHHYGAVGHKRADCRKLKQETKNVETAKAAVDSSTKDDPAAFAFKVKIQGNGASINSTWYLDSRSSEHFAISQTKLINVRKLNTPVCIRVAKSRQVLTAMEIGGLQINVRVNGKRNEIIINEILKVSGLQCNLLSVRKLEMKDYTIFFENKTGTIRKGNRVAAMALRKGKLYELHFEYGTEFAGVCKADENTLLWHQRLGHISDAGMKKLAEMADGITAETASFLTRLC